MSTVRSSLETWETEKQAYAAHLYTALAALVGDVESLRLSSASLSWRTAAGVQGHWREEAGQVWLGRIVWTPEGRQSEQLVLALAPRERPPGQAEEDRPRLVHPTAHYCRRADDPPVGFEPDTPQLYEAALALLSQLTAELHAMLPPHGQAEEGTSDAS